MTRAATSIGSERGNRPSIVAYSTTIALMRPTRIELLSLPPIVANPEAYLRVPIGYDFFLRQIAGVANADCELRPFKLLGLRTRLFWRHCPDLAVVDACVARAGDR